ncbi:MAG: sigma-70 family RNA polymerase sigma factor [Phycisphaerales bacterium]|nr:sigma-70 family RNA polymerase sigma factor [Phycisphaerales bacterium]
MSSLPRPIADDSGFLDDVTALRLYAKRGDPSAFDVLARRYQGMVLATCRRVLRNESDAEDAAQEAFLKLARHAGSIRSHAGAWLHAAAMGCSIDLIRRAESRKRAEREAGVMEASGREEGAGYALWSEIEPMLDEAIAALEVSDRELIVGRFLSDRSQREMAIELGVSDGTVQRRTHKALERLRKKLVARGLVVGGVTALGGALGYSTLGQGSLTLSGSLSKIGLLGIAQNGARSVVMSKVTIAATVVAVMGVVAVSVLTMNSGSGTRGGSSGSGGIMGLGAGIAQDAPDRPRGKIGPFEIVSAGERNLFDRGVWISDGALVMNHGIEPESGEVKSARLKILGIDESAVEDGLVVIDTRVERILPIGDEWSRFKLGQRVEMTAGFDDVGRLVIRPMTEGVQLGRNEPGWYGVRPPLGWQEHGRIPEDAGEFGLLGPWTEAERIPVTITAREIRFGTDSWVAALYRIIEWTKEDGHARVLSVHAGGRDPRLIGTRFRLLIREVDGGYEVAYFLPGTKQSDRWPSSFEYSAENPVQIVLIDGEG